MDRIYTQAGGTGLNASTSEDRTFYIVSLPSNKLELWFWLESDRLANPVFREFYSERDVILEERRQTLESRPGGVVGEAFNAMTWMASPYHWEVIGWPSDISQVTREQANEFFATYYAPNNITAILVGDFDRRSGLRPRREVLRPDPREPEGRAGGDHARAPAAGRAADGGGGGDDSRPCRSSGRRSPPSTRTRPPSRPWPASSAAPRCSWAGPGARAACGRPPAACTRPSCSTRRSPPARRPPRAG